MTAVDLPAIRALLARITPGGWAHAQGVTPYVAKRDWVEVQNQATICVEVRPADAAFIAAAPSIVAQLLAVVEAQQKALDALMYVANHKAADNERGRWWAEVIRGPIIQHLGAEEAAKLGAITGEGQS